MIFQQNFQRQKIEEIITIMKEQQALNIKFVEYTKKAGGKVKKRHQGIRLFFFRYILSIFMQDSLKANSSHNFFIY